MQVLPQPFTCRRGGLFSLAAVATLAIASGSLVGCGDDDRQGTQLDSVEGDTSGDVLSDSTTSDTTLTGTSVGDSSSDSTGDSTGDSTTDAEDTFVPECETDPGSLLCPCDDNEDCNSGYCIPSGLGDQVCSVVCQGLCPAGLDCRLVQFPGQDATFLCVDTLANLCRPCNQNSDCQGNFGSIADRCVSFGAEVGAFCGVGCEDDDRCPDGYTCLAVGPEGNQTKQCTPDSAACSCSVRAVLESASTSCSRAQCSGERVCTEDGLSACSAQEITTEICDGMDNNCNGAVDESFVNTDGDSLADCVDDDDDDDTILDVDDNCPLDANTDQTDTDNDGVGDACDTPTAPTFDTTDPPSPSNDNSPAVSGTGEPGTVVSIYIGNGCVGVAAAQVVVGDDGSWTAAINVGDDARHTLYADASDPDSSRTSECSEEPLVYIEDSTSPLPPNLTGTDPPSPGGANDVTIRGVSEAGSQVTFYTDAACTTAAGLTAVAGSDGALNVPTSVADGEEVTYYASASDAAGNVSSCSGAVTYRHDANAPAAPVLTTTIPTSPSDSVTDPILVGQSEPGTTVSLYLTDDCTGDIVTSIMVGDNGLFTTAVSVEPNSTNVFYAAATDGAGNRSGCSLDGLTYIHDNEDPLPPTLTGTDPESPGDTTAPAIEGTSEPFATVKIFLGAGCTGFLVGEVIADDTGAFSVVVGVAANAETFLYANATDQAGRESDCTPAPLSYIHDGTLPGQVIFTRTQPGSPSSNPTPAIGGTAEANGTVTLYIDETCTIPANATGAVGSDGTFVVAVAVAANTATTYWGIVTDTAGNTSGCSVDSITYTHDDIAPDAPSLTGTNPPSPAATATPNVEGVAESAATVVIYSDANCTTAVGSGMAGDTGIFEISVTLPVNSETALYGDATDAAGNRSACSADPITYLHDDSEPLVPVITASTPVSPSNTSTTPTLSGTAENNTTVEIHLSADCSDATPAASVSVAPAGTFDAPVTVTENSTTAFYAVSLDTAGNPSPCSPQGFTYVHDSIPPAIPVLVETAPESPSNASTTPTVSGTADPDTDVSVYAASDCVANFVGTTASDGTFAVTASVGLNTTTTFYAASVDAAGNVSDCTAVGLTYIHDNRAPLPPNLFETDPSSPGTTTMPNVLGTAEGNSAVMLYTDADCTGSVAGQGTSSGTTGQFTISALVGGNTTTQIYGTATDLAGNTSVCSDPIAYNNDVEPPTTPAWIASQPPSPNGTSTTPLLTGQTDPGVEVRLYVGNFCTEVHTMTTTSSATGAFSFTVSVAPNSTTRFYAAAVDDLGNRSNCTDPELVYIHDTDGPGAPTITGSRPSSPGMDRTPDIDGTSEPDVIINIYRNGTCSGPSIGSVTSSSVGTWTIPGVSVLANVSNTLSANARDSVGNVSGCATPYIYIHDDIAPAAPVVTGTAPSSPASDATPAVQGTAERLSVVRVYADADCLLSVRGSGVTSPGGNFAINAQANLNNTTVFYAQATDSAGNVSACSSTSTTYVHDASAPDAPVMVSTTPEPWSNTVSDPIVAGTAEPDSVVTVYGASNCGGTALATDVPVDAAGDWSVVIDIGPDNNDVNFAARSTDAAENTSGCSGNSLYYRYDTIPPVFAGVVSVSANGDQDTRLRVNWSNASDNFTISSNMVYLVCLSTRCGAVDCDFDDPDSPLITVTGAGVRNLLYTGLTPNTRYYAVVRARDEVGNLEDNTKVVSFKTKGLNAGVDLAVGDNLACLQLADGTDTCWGPSSIPSNVTDPIHFSIGPSHACAVRRTGQVRCWGTNTAGQLGNNSNADSASSVAVSGITDAIKVGVGSQHSCALSVDGTVRCWGRDEQSQLGNGLLVQVDQPVPVLVTTDFDGLVPLTDATDLAVGFNHACALRADGTTWCWGDNGDAQLGTGTNQDSGYAIDSGQNGLIAIVAGQGHTCGINAAGRAICWGWNGWGQIGNGDFPNDATMPQDVGLSNVVSIGSSNLHTCATLANGTAWCWGQNLSGQIGTGAKSSNVSTPSQVQGIDAVVDIGGGNDFTCLRRGDGTAWCLGSNDGGRLGGATGTESLVPVQVTVPIGLAGVTGVALRHEHACATLSDGSARCWGRNTDGQLGNGESMVDAAPLAVVSPLGGAIQIATGGNHSCALTATGALTCWGGNDAGQLGIGDTTPKRSPTSVALSNVRQVTLGRRHTCALLTGGTVSCWGARGSGQIGDGNTGGNQLTPTSVPLLTQVTAVSAGVDHTCALRVDGKVHCWGANATGQVTGTAGGFISRPVVFSGADHFTTVAAGGGHTCGVGSDGKVRCWGDNVRGQLGGDDFGGANTVRTVQLSGADLVNIVGVSAGVRHSCAVRLNDDAFCWGDNTPGEVGRNSSTQLYNSAQAVTTSSMRAPVLVISAGDDNTCASTSEGEAWCWGDNDATALGTNKPASNDERLPRIVECLP